jgi:hypothetical protein
MLTSMAPVVSVGIDESYVTIEEGAAGVAGAAGEERQVSIDTRHTTTHYCDPMACLFVLPTETSFNLPCRRERNQ